MGTIRCVGMDNTIYVCRKRTGYSADHVPLVVNVNELTVTPCPNPQVCFRRRQKGDGVDAASGFGDSDEIVADGD